MAQRQNQVRHDSAEVQGEGSYVVLRRFTLGEYLEFKALANDPADVEGIAAAKFAIKTTVVKWNWVDDDGQALPLPADGLDLTLLSTEEVGFIVRHCTARREQPEAKN